MAHTHLMLLAIDRREPTAGLPYLDARSLLDRLRADVITLFPQAREVRANRSTVEFLADFASPTEAARRLEALRRDLIAAVDADGRLAGRRVTIATVACGEDPVDGAIVSQAKELLRRARASDLPLAMEARHAADRHDATLLADLRTAMARNELELHYQPKLNARTGKLAGCEALLRWFHPTLGPVSPQLFVSAAERSGDIGALTTWVVDRAMSDRQTMADAGQPMLVHVNVSAPLLGDAAFCAALLHQLRDQAGRIGIEITETSMIADPEGTLARLHGFAAAGLHLSIDDYGTGFSSLAYLQRMPVHELKIDRSFITSLSSSARDPLLVRSTINLAHALEMQVTAEGVETAGSLALLQVMGCDLVQGYFMSAALPLDRFLGYARDHVAEQALPRPTSLRQRMAQRRALVGDPS